MKDATTCAPHTCTCGRRLGKPQFGWPWTKPSAVLGQWPHPDCTRVLHHQTAKVWFVPCQCGLRHIWSYPERYLARSIDPLFDSKTDTTRAKP